MQFRQFGATDLRVSEVGFGAWGIGGESYGAVDRDQAKRALAVAEELGCTFLDTAAVYGDSERIVGEFLTGRRDRWVLATKYSGQETGLVATVEDQLRRLRVDGIDFYQIHWAPRDRDDLYEDLVRLKSSGKVRYVGVSLYTEADVDYVAGRGDLDGLQVPFGLLDPEPFLPSVERIRARGLGVAVRSSLKGGFLTGKFARGIVFQDPADQRSKWSDAQISKTLAAVERFRFLESGARTMLIAAARYPLSYPEVSTVLLGTKNEAQARVNFGEVPGDTLDDETLERIRSVQQELGLPERKSRALWVKRLARRLLRR